MDKDVVSQRIFATASLRRDDEYFDLAYDEWLHHRSKYRRIALPISITWLIASGLLVGLLGLQIAWVAIGIGVFDLIEVVSHRSRSTALMKGAIDNRDLALRFGESSIEVEVNGEIDPISYSYYERAEPTPHGVFLIANARESTFVPFAAVSPSGAAALLVETLQAKIG